MADDKFTKDRPLEDGELNQEIEPEVVLPMDSEEESAPTEIEPAKDEPVGLAAELGAEEIPPEESDAMEQDIEGEPEQEITEGVEGPPADDLSSVVKVEFIDDGDDFEMDAAIAGVKGESPYPDMRGQEPPPYEPPSPADKPPEDGETPEGETTKSGAWTPPNISIQELMDMEPASMFYNNSVKDVVASEREMRSAKDRANRQQLIADLRPRPEIEKEKPIERIKGMFRRLVGIEKSYPAPHCGRPDEQGGSAPRDSCAGGGAAEGAGVAARPEHVGASIKLQKMANPRTTSHMNDSDLNAWEEINDTSSEWGTNKETGEMMDSGSWAIASQVVENVEGEMGRDAYEPASGPDVYIVQQYVDDLINSDTDADHYEVENALKKLYEETKKEGLGLNPTWEEISKFIEKSQDEMEGMSDKDIDDAVVRKVSLGVIDILEEGEKGTDIGIEDWVLNFALEQDSAKMLRDDIDDYGGDVVDYLQSQAYDVIYDHHQQNPVGYDYDYLVDEFGIEPSSLGVTEGSGDEYGGDDIGGGDRTYFYSTDNETGEIVAVMQTTRAYEDVSQSRIEEAAARFGFDADEVNSQMLVIDLLASKYPRQGYGTEMILQALKQAHEEDRGVSGSAVMAAAMFYDKLGAQYLSEMGQTQGGSAFWTNVQVHAAYEWLQSQMSAIESGEVTTAEIGAEQAQAETREDEPPASRKRPSSTPEWQGSTPETLRELDGTRWTNPGAGGADVVIDYNDNRGEWSARDLNDDGNELFNYDAEDAGYFFERLANEGLTVPEVASTPSPQHIAVAITDGLLSIHVDEGPPTPAPQTLGEVVGAVAPESLRAMTGTTWRTPQGVGNITIDHDPVQHAWFATDPGGNEIYTNDEEDVSTFFSQLNRDGFRPTNPYIANAQTIGNAILAGHLSTDIDEVTPTSTQQIFGESAQQSNLVDFLGRPQADYLGIQNPAAANSTFVSFVHADSDIPVVAMEVNPDRVGGDRIFEIIGSGQLYGSQAGLLTSARAGGWIATEYGVVGSDRFGTVLEGIDGEQNAQRFTYNMLRQSQEANRRLREEEPISLEEASVARSAMRRVEKSYPAPHCGRPGEEGGSAPRDTCAAGGKTRVGVTSARKGKENKQVFDEMRSFASELNKITSISNVSVTPGVGGWEGEREATWVVSYEGNGKAMRLIARTAKMHGQDAVIFAREGGEEPISSFAFSDRVTPNERDEVENLLVEAKVGWTWLRLPGGKPTLMIMNVPQYGGEAEVHRKTMSKLAHMFDAIEMPHEFNEVVKKVDLLEKEGPYGYDTILEAGN
jgi:hypothetical protein